MDLSSRLSYLGVSDFEEIRTTGSYFVDKSPYIPVVMNDKAKVILFTRPRRFGKTTFLSMLAAFLDCTKDRKDLFDGLAVMKDQDFVSQYMGAFPVIFLSFKGIDGVDFEDALGQIRILLSKLYKAHLDLAKDIVLNSEKERFIRILDEKSDGLDIKEALSLLADLLTARHGRKPVLLIDEYDAPLTKAMDRGYLNEFRDVFNKLLGFTKDSNNLEKTVMTGCIRLSESSIFSGRNNISFRTLANGGVYDTCFGLSQEEVDDCLKAFKLEDKRDEVASWYNGYMIGGKRVYSTWSVLQYVDEHVKNHDAVPRCYWVESSSNAEIRYFLERRGFFFESEIGELLAGGRICKKIHDSITYDDLDSKDDNELVWSLLFESGYLTLDGPWSADGPCVLKIPNREVMNIYRDKLDAWTRSRLASLDRRPLVDALLNGDCEKLSELVSEYLWNSISYYDQKESFYHGFMTSLFTGIEGVDVQSNQESGDGRPDLMVYCHPKSTVIVMEFKHARSEDEIAKAMEKARSQILTLKYAEGVKGYHNMLCYAVVFYKKTAFFSFVTPDDAL